ncbi:Para-hydroxybenzoate--polyprenyltransferase, mitochondrial precursor (PHB:polyprenyltransferase) [Elasticomyces elasticus]|nr:Para-hydroxybenzoate--polyprenyltransferase, mitochondrial precursor (PHB:polyprenyltransferase) [Elasticomyces elasticus]
MSTFVRCRTVVRPSSLSISLESCYSWRCSGAVEVPVGRKNYRSASTYLAKHANLRPPRITTVATSRTARGPAPYLYSARIGDRFPGIVKRPSTTSTPQNDAPTPPPPYSPPTTGLLSYLPSAAVPYAELIRLDKPVGTYYLFFPCLFSTLLAAPLTTPITPPLPVLCTPLLFLAGALIMRGAGCTINDLWDRDLDPHVARTRLRPIARGAVSPRAALVFTGAQLLAGLAVLLQFPGPCLYYAAPSLLLVAMYPLAKRVTHYPQFVLGLTFSWGAFMGFPALGIDLVADAAAAGAAAALYASNVAWTVLYDMIYAHMDIRDDVKAGIKSIALAHASSKTFLAGLAIAQVGLLAVAGAVVGAGPVFFVGSCGSAALTLAVMIRRVRLDSVESCWWWFRNGCWFTGGGIALGLAGEYVAQYLGLYNKVENKGVDTKSD